ncbi:MAG: low specificity L-threonine aldolase [Silicimonas sp.]|jgi:threonine aldolase|nr:low specificity L-threonine aldolase [Silicimonas sp.]
MRFASDNSGPVHPKIMAALQAANEGWALPYGNDDLTRAAADRVRDVFEAPEAAVYFVATGSAANVLSLATVTKPFQTIFCTPEAHIEEDECNGPEFYTGGAKLTLIESAEAKMNADALARVLAAKAGRSVHGAQPGPLSITQLTERGTLYSISEIKALSGIAKANGLPVHLDGARFANAMVALGCSAAEMSWKAGVDIVSFGGTKNGLMGAEAVVIFDADLAWEFELRRKRGGHLFSKNRFLAAQMEAYLADDLWLDMARTANASAQRIAAGLQAIEGVRLLYPAAANMIYAEFPAAAHRRLHDAGAQYYPAKGATEGADEAPHSARIVADWSCPDANIERFLALVRGD